MGERTLTAPDQEIDGAPCTCAPRAVWQSAPRSLWHHACAAAVLSVRACLVRAGSAGLCDGSLAALRDSEHRMACTWSMTGDVEPSVSWLTLYTRLAIFALHSPPRSTSVPRLALLQAFSLAFTLAFAHSPSSRTRMIRFALQRSA